MTSLKIENGKVFVNGEETSNPEHIGFAVLDIAEEHSEMDIELLEITSKELITS